MFAGSRALVFPSLSALLAVLTDVFPRNALLCEATETFCLPLASGSNCARSLVSAALKCSLYWLGNQRMCRCSQVLLMCSCPPCCLGREHNKFLHINNFSTRNRRNQNKTKVTGQESKLGLWLLSFLVWSELCSSN